MLGSGLPALTASLRLLLASLSSRIVDPGMTSNRSETDIRVHGLVSGTNTKWQAAVNPPKINWSQKLIYLR